MIASPQAPARYIPHRPPPVFLPFEAMLYDQAAHNELVKAHECYLDTFPLCVAKNNELITDENLLRAARTAEAFLYNFSMKFGIMGSSGEWLHDTYKDQDVRAQDTPAHIAEVFCMLSIMLSHPVYTMLHAVYSVVYARTKPPAALRDTRRMFKATKNKLSAVGIYEFYHSLVTMLREFTLNAVNANDTEITRRAKSDFDKFAIEETTGKTLVDEVNWGTAVMLAINVLESGGRAGRQLN